MSSLTVQLYQMRDTVENQRYLFRPLQYILEHGGTVHANRYEMVLEEPLIPNLNIGTIRKNLESRISRNSGNRALSVSDVIVLQRKDETDSYFIDVIGMIAVPDFFERHNPGSAALITDRTENYEIRGKPGLWSVVDTMVVEQSVFFLMENAKYGRDVPSVVLDAMGTVVIEDCRNDFDDNAVQQIRRFLHSQTSFQIHKKPEPELYQRYFENGEYVRAVSPEVREEANYNMIDGLRNNADPKKRPSVRKRLREKLALVHGPVPSPRERTKG